MTTQIRVLHVDDESDLQKSLSERLEGAAERIDVTSVATPATVIDRLESEPVNCVVSSYQMPETDGLELLSQVRDRWPDLPFVLYTNRGSEAVASEAISEDVTEYVQRPDGPGDFESLAQQIVAATEQRRASQFERIADLVREIQSDLVGARTREAIDEGVCDRLVEAEPYVFAWIGTVDADSDRVTPRASAGQNGDYLGAVEITTDESATGQGPTGRAVRTGSIQVSRAIAEDAEYEPWREKALERGYRSSGAVPIEYEGTLYGVLNVYADRPNAFDADEQAVLSDLARTVAHAHYRVQVRDQYESQYQELFEDAPVMMAFTREESGEPIVENCNRRFASELGYSSAELCGRPLAELYTEESAQRLLDQGGYEQALEGEFAPQEREFVTADGERRVTLLQATPRRNDDGEVVGTHALYVDISERKRAQSVLERAEAMEASIDGMAILDESGEYVYANDAHAEVYGYDSPAALVGNSWRMLYDDAEAQRLEGEVFRELSGGGEWRGEATGTRADGTTFPQELSLTRLEDGSTVCVVRDITERTERERELERKNDLFERAQEIADLGAWETDLRTGEGWWTEQVNRIYGLKPGYEPEPGEGIEYFHPEDRPVIREAYERAVEEVEPYDLELRVEGKDGVLRWVQVRGDAICEGGDVVRVRGTIRDITERKEYERNLEAQRDNLEVLNQVVRHDIRNDLQIVLAYSETLQAYVEEGGAEYIEKVLDAARDAVDITTMARDVTEVMLQTDADSHPVRLRPVLANEVDDVRSNHEHALVRLHGTIPTVDVCADDMLESVFRNLLNNAVQHNDREVPEVTVSATRADGAVQVRVADNGPGIPDERREDIFEQGEMGLDSAGTGLGLYLVDTLVDRYGGEIRVKDNDPEGTVFVVELPLAE
jgi:PAS domain S-box-containing protein